MLESIEGKTGALFLPCCTRDLKPYAGMDLSEF